MPATSGEIAGRIGSVTATATGFGTATFGAAVVVVVDRSASVVDVVGAGASVVTGAAVLTGAAVVGVTAASADASSVASGIVSSAPAEAVCRDVGGVGR